MSQQVQLKLPHKLAYVFTELEKKLSPEDREHILNEIAGVLAKLVDFSEKFHCSPVEFFEELANTYADLEDIALRGNAICEVRITDEKVIGVGNVYIPPLLASKREAVLRRQAMRNSVANTIQPEPVS